LGLLIAVFLAAYMSTIASQLNWGTSYLINDFYRRFITPSATEKHYVIISRLVMFLLIIFSLLITWLFITKISGAWEFIINASAGMGAVLILRWYWWRINAWSEISAMIIPLVIYPVVRYVFLIKPPISLFPTVLGTTIVWMVITFLTKPEREETLRNFYKKVEPWNGGWKRFSKYSTMKKDGLGKLIVCWLLGIILIYSALLGCGKILFGNYLAGILLLLFGCISGIIIWKLIKRGKL